MTTATDSPSSSRALVRLVSDQHEPHPIAATRGVSTFVAQLIANVRGVPQARERRRADATEVIAAYRETVERIRALNIKC